MNYCREVFVLQLIVLIMIAHYGNADRALVEFHQTIFDYSNEPNPPISAENATKTFLTRTFSSCDNVIDVIFQTPQAIDEVNYWVVSNDEQVTREQLQDCYQREVKGNALAEASNPFTGLCLAQHLNGFGIPCSQIHVVSFSIDQCPSGAPQASIRCDYGTVNTQYGLLQTVQFDVKTMRITRCNYTIADVLQKLSANITSLSERELNDEIEQLNLLSSQKNLLIEDVKDIVRVLNHTSSYLLQANQQISVEAFSRFLDTTSKVNLFYEEFRDDNQISAEDRYRLVDLARKASRLVKINETTKFARFVTETIILQVNELTEESRNEAISFSTFGSDYPEETKKDAVEATISSSIIENAFRQSSSPNIRVTFIAFASDNIFPSTEAAQGITLIEIYDPENPQETFQLNNVDNAVNIFHDYETRKFGRQEVYNSNTEVEDLDFVHFQCVYWNEDYFAWDSHGCYYDISREATCICNHLTSFAIIISIYPTPKDLALSISSFIGCGITVALLLLTIILHLLNRKLKLDQ